jgi:hypothetical protein
MLCCVFGSNLINFLFSGKYACMFELSMFEMFAK